MDFPPVPLWLVKSPPWHIKSVMTRWKDDPLYPNPFSPVQSALKFSAVLGTTSERSSMTMRPSAAPSAVMSKYTLGKDLQMSRIHFMEWRDSMWASEWVSELLFCIFILVIIFSFLSGCHLCTNDEDEAKGPVDDHNTGNPQAGPSA